MNTDTFGFPAWIANPQLAADWIVKHQVEIALFGGIAMLFFLVVCFAIGRWLNVDPKKSKKKEFGKSVWADENVLRKRGHLSKDL